MYTVILGGGRIGTRLSNWYLSAGNEVTIIENDETKLTAIARLLGPIGFEGDGTCVDTLRKAGVGRADLFISTLRHDDENIVACQLVKHQFEVAKTVSIVNDPEYANLFHTLGVDVVVNITDVAVNTIEEETARLMVEGV